MLKKAADATGIGDAIIAEARSVVSNGAKKKAEVVRTKDLVKNLWKKGGKIGVVAAAASSS